MTNWLSEAGAVKDEPYEYYVKRMEALGWTVLPASVPLTNNKEGYTYVLEGDTYGPARNGYPSNETKEGSDE